MSNSPEEAETQPVDNTAVYNLVYEIRHLRNIVLVLAIALLITLLIAASNISEDIDDNTTAINGLTEELYADYESIWYSLDEQNSYLYVVACRNYHSRPNSGNDSSSTTSTVPPPPPGGTSYTVADIIDSTCSQRLYDPGPKQPDVMDPIPTTHSVPN